MYVVPVEAKNKKRMIKIANTTNPSRFNSPAIVATYLPNVFFLVYQADVF
jgi:hypothetical protein